MEMPGFALTVLCCAELWTFSCSPIHQNISALWPVDSVQKSHVVLGHFRHRFLASNHEVMETVEAALRGGTSPTLVLGGR